MKLLKEWRKSLDMIFILGGKIMKIKKMLVILVALVLMLNTSAVGLSVAAVDNTALEAGNDLTAEAIRFNSEGKLKILHITDTHLEKLLHREVTLWMIERICDIEKPDVVILTGDNVINYDDAEVTKGIISDLMGIFESRGLPIAVTFGNHDSEQGAMSREELMACYNSFSASISVDDGEVLSHCGTYNIPVLASDSDKVKFNLWVFDSGDYYEGDDSRYDCVQPDQIEWYKETSAKLRKANGGETVNSLAFQHIIVPEVYDALEQIDFWQPFAVSHIYNSGEYYTFDADGTNYGILKEKPCPGYVNYGQFDAMVESGDVLAMFTGHDHSNGFGVRYEDIDIYTTPSTRYKGSAYSTQFGYRIIEVDENDTSTYETRVMRHYDVFDFTYAMEVLGEGDILSVSRAFELAIKGTVQKAFEKVYSTMAETLTGRKVAYPESVQ